MFSGQCKIKNLAIEVYKKDGVLKKINMRVCPHCGRKYLVRDKIPESIDLSEYCVVERI